MIDFIVVFFIYGIHFIISRKAYVIVLGMVYMDILHIITAVFYIFLCTFHNRTHLHFFAIPQTMKIYKVYPIFSII